MPAHLDPIVLFFILGAVAAWLKADLSLPDQVARFLAKFLLLAIGLKGGHNVATQGLTGLLPVLVLGLSCCFIIPIVYFVSFRNRLGAVNAASLAACYGSVSAVTFITAQNALSLAEIPFSGFMIAVMAMMEIPAIAIAILFLNRAKGQEGGALKKTFSSKSIVLLVGGFLIGLVLRDSDWKTISPVFSDAFKGVLAFYLIDLGFLAQGQLRNAVGKPVSCLLVGVIFPLVFGLSALFIGKWTGISQGDRVLLACLAGGASYIAAPAAIRAAAPEANPAYYAAMPLAVTFPFNVLVALPFYIFLARQIG